MASFFDELKRRNVFKVAVAYAIVAWLLIEVVTTVFPLFEFPVWTSQLVTIIILIGFPIAMIFAWAFELTPEGIKSSKSVESDESITHVTGRKLDFIIIGVLVLAVVFMFIDNYVLISEPQTTTTEPIAEVAPSVEVVEEVTAPIEEEPQREVLPNSVAVLPFENMSADPEHAYFAPGIHDEILNQLAKLSALNVIARTSVQQYANTEKSILEIAEELNVETVMEGSVRYAGGQVRITTQLNDGLTGAHLWSETYTRDFEDIFAIESDVAVRVANALEAEFSPEEQQSIEKVPTNSPAAYALYLSALSRGAGVNDMLLNLRDLDAAIELDPEFALAYAQRAWSYAAGLVFSNQVPVAEYERNAVASAEQALILDPTTGLAHAVLAAIDGLNWDWAEVPRRTALAYQLNPNDIGVLLQYVRFTRDAGDYDESIRAAERWVQLDPNSAAVYLQLAVTNRFARRYDASATAAQKGIEMNPASGSLHLHLAYAQAARGNRDEAASNLQIAEQLFGGNFTQVFRVSQMAMIYSLVGRREDAERMLVLLEELDRDGNAVGEAIWAQAHIALGNYDQALQQLEAAMDSPSSVNYTTLIEIKANPWAIPELDTPRFREVLSGLWSVD